MMLSMRRRRCLVRASFVFLYLNVPPPLSLPLLLLDTDAETGINTKRLLPP